MKSPPGAPDWLETFTAAERPDLWYLAKTGPAFDGLWPEYNMHGNQTSRYFGALFPRFAHLQVLFVDKRFERLVPQRADNSPALGRHALGPASRNRRDWEPLSGRSGGTYRPLSARRGGRARLPGPALERSRAKGDGRSGTRERPRPAARSRASLVEGPLPTCADRALRRMVSPRWSALRSMDASPCPPGRLHSAR